MPELIELHVRGGGLVLELDPAIAPVKAAVLPLSKKLSEPAKKIYVDLLRETGMNIEFDDAGSIGKRYRRHDEIGTPVCFTYDFESEQDNTVTARNRDTMKQERVSVERLAEYVRTIVARN